MRKMISFADVLKEEMKDPEFARHFDEEEIYASVAIALAKEREAKGLSQKQLAKKMKTTQQTVSRLESTTNHSYSLKTLFKVARALGKRIQVKFV